MPEHSRLLPFCTFLYLYSLSVPSIPYLSFSRHTNLGQQSAEKQGMSWEASAGFHSEVRAVDPTRTANNKYRTTSLGTFLPGMCSSPPIHCWNEVGERAKYIIQAKVMKNTIGNAACALSTKRWDPLCSLLTPYALSLSLCSLLCSALGCEEWAEWAGPTRAPARSSSPMGSAVCSLLFALLCFAQQ